MRTPPTDFVHLHVHTMYSLLDGAIRLEALFERVKQFGMHSVAITDHGTMFNVLEFYQKAVKAGIKPIIGCECYVAPRTLTDRSALDAKGLSHLVLLAENQQGYRNLCKLASIAQTEGFYYRPRIDKTVLKAHSEGLIALSACLHGEIPLLINEGRIDRAEEAALFYQELFGPDNFFLEVQNNGIDKQDIVNAALREMSAKLSIPLVASNDCHYLDKADVRAHDVLLCVQTGKTVNDSDRFRFRTDQLYFKSKEEMIHYFKDFPGAIENTVAIAQRCQLAFDMDGYHFPLFKDDSGLSAAALFTRKVNEGFQAVWQLIRSKHPDADEPVYRTRLDYEIGVINKMEFPGYFLIVADFINYAKQNKIPVGPGRGSAAGSLVAYSLGITDLDPIEHGLIFERFLNPDRISMPDIDVDFCINGRDRVFKYVVERYGGWDYVAQIITFGKLKTRAVIRDVGRALDIPLPEVDAIAKLVPDVLNISLDKALEQEPKLRELQADRPDIADLINICRTLEGLPRHASTHAAGVVIGDKPLVNYLPLYKGKKGEVVTQFDMKLVEDIGLVKFDFLGLRNLTVIDQALALIRQHKTPPDLSCLDFNDAATYALLAAGDTTGVFQLESSGMKDLLIRLRPESFAEVTALVALYRPGPLDSGMVDDFVERKHGRKAVEYMLSDLEPILRETYGVIVYQEQVMKIANDLASYTMGEADGLRKAMGKKIAAMMAEHRERFVKGAVANGHNEKKALALFDLMEKFGGYGFNKSHSAAYALIAFQTAYLKAHFPLEFIAALLTSEMHSIDGVVKYINECRSHQIEVCPPDVNAGETNFAVSGDKILFGLVAVKNIGEGAVEAIVTERRTNGAFKSLFDFCERVDSRKVNKRVVEALIACGAFDSTEGARAQMMAVLEEALEYGQKVQKERCDPQMGLFDEGPACALSISPPELPKIEEWPERERLAREKEALGFFISGHPLTPYQHIMTKFGSTTTTTLEEIGNGQTVRIGGMLASRKLTRTKKKEEWMAFVQLEDMLGGVEVVVFPSVYAGCQDLLTVDRPLFVQGKVQKDEKGPKILADSVIAMEDAETLWTAEVYFNIDVPRTAPDTLSRLREVVRRFPGDCQGWLNLKMEENVETIIAMSDEWRFEPSDALRREVKALLGYSAVETRCSEIKPAENGNGFKRRNGYKRN